MFPRDSNPAAAETLRIAIERRASPPPDGRPRTTSADLPEAAASWLRELLGADLRLAPADQLVNSNHCFYVSWQRERFFLKVGNWADAPLRLGREALVLQHLRGSGVPVPEPVAYRALDGGLAVLLMGWLDASPLRYLDFHGSLASTYLRRLGVILGDLHRSLQDLRMPAELTAWTEGELDPPPAALEPAAHHFLGAARTRWFLDRREAAARWLRRTPWQMVHGDLQDKNILLGSTGSLFLCDFEAVRRGPVVGDLTVDRIYLKRELPEVERSVLQGLLLAGYGCAQEFLDAKAAAQLRLLRLGRLMHWQFHREPMPDRRQAEAFAASVDRLSRFLQSAP